MQMNESLTTIIQNGFQDDGQKGNSGGKKLMKANKILLEGNIIRYIWHWSVCMGLCGFYYFLLLVC